MSASFRISSGQKGPDLRRDYDDFQELIPELFHRQKGPDLRRDYDAVKSMALRWSSIWVRKDLIYEGITTNNTWPYPVEIIVRNDLIYEGITTYI